jgi:uncharacterized protein with GYD domain
MTPLLRWHTRCGEGRQGVVADIRRWDDRKERVPMPSYVSLFKWTDQGARTVKETVSRSEQVTQGAERMGGRVTQLLWTQGAYDIIAISEWPDDTAAQAFLLQVATIGSVRSETLRAFSAQEMTRILAKLS